MSDNWLKLIALDPEWVPDEEMQERARQLLASFVSDAEEVHARTYDAITFIDAGINLERLACPRCSTPLDFGWWADEMSRLSNTRHVRGHFDSIEVTTPCCAAQTSLNDLVYGWPVGFARFSLEARNPNVPDLTDSQMRSLEKELGRPLRRIRAHL